LTREDSMNRVFAVLVLAMISLAGCAITSNPTLQHGLGARAEVPDLCELTVVNEMPGAFKFRIGHLWWEEQSSLLPHTTTGNRPMLVEQDEHHELVRYYWVEGRMYEDVYRFFIPKGVRKHTITFGGLQEGILLNRSGETVRVMPPASGTAVVKGLSPLRDALLSNDTTAVFADLIPDSVRTWGVVLHPGEYIRYKVQGPKPTFVFFFGQGPAERYIEVGYRINDVHADSYFENGKSGQWVDWLGYIEPRHVRAAATKR